LKPETENLKLSHEVAYTWNEHGRLASVKSLAGEFLYEYDEANPALLTKMTGPAHSVETSYEAHRNLITGVVNRGMGFQPMDRAGTSDPQPTAPSLTEAPATAPTPAPAADSGPKTTDKGSVWGQEDWWVRYGQPILRNDFLVDIHVTHTLEITLSVNR